MSDPSKFFNPSTNYNKHFNNPRFINELISQIRNKLNRQLMMPEKQFIANYLKNVNPVLFNNKPQVILTTIVNDLVKQLLQFKCEVTDEINIHEILKKEIGASNDDDSAEIAIGSSDVSFTQQITNSFANTVDIASIFGSKTFDSIKSIFNPAAAVKTTYLMLDTRFRTLETDGTISFKWNYTNTSNTTQGSINSIGDIQNIVSMRVLPFRIPYYKLAPNNIYNKITMYIQEFSAQSYIGHENSRFHFVFPINIDKGYINLEVNRDMDAVYNFKTPIARLDTLTINFASPLQPIIFDTDRMNMQISSYGTSTEFVSIIPHNLETGDIVYVNGFTTANPNLDTPITSQFADLNGIIVENIDDTHISLPINTTNLVYAGSGTVNVTAASTNVTGVGTTFTSMFSANDVIAISGIKYSILSVNSDTSLVLKLPYPGITATGLTYGKNNTLTGLNPGFYFGSKRHFIPMQFDYIPNV
jgi:hypothetical protein